MDEASKQIPLFARFLPLLLAACTALAQSPVGAQTCAGCHHEQHSEWSNARHSKMLQPAGTQSVLGDFARGMIVLHGASYRLRSTGAAFFITVPESAGPREFRVDYTLGSRRIQHYLTKLADGRIVVLAPSWDVQRKEWFHNMDIVDPEEGGSDKVQVWNKNCYSCHVSREQKNFDVARNVYDTQWQDFGTNCERCHGSGSNHVQARLSGTANAPAMVVPSRLPHERSSMVCAQCHSAREMIADNFQAGSNYFDYFLPILEYGQKASADPAYWPDGRTRRFSNDAIGLWQSECFLRGGATCVNCHSNVHDPQIERNPALKPGANAICTGCHAEIGSNAAQHSRHAEGSPGTACVECHMPRTVFSVKAQIRDHSMSIPVPENTGKYGIPNACNQCHGDRDSQWAASKMDEWWGPDSRAKLRDRAAAFSQARAGNRAAIDALLRILSDPEQGPVARANAAGHLGRFGDDARASTALRAALTDPSDLVRAIAAQRVPLRGLPETEANRTAEALTRALSDPVRAVRAGAVLTLADGGKATPGPALEQAKKDYLDRAAIHIDDPAEQLNAGKFALLLNDSAAAIRALETSLKLSGSPSVRYPLGLSYLLDGRREDALKMLKTVPSGDPSYADAQRVIQRLAAN